MAQVRFSLAESQPSRSPVLFGMPFDTPEQTVLTIDVPQGRYLGTVQADNSGQTAMLIEPIAGQVAVDVHFSDGGSAFPPWLFNPTGGNHETPSEELIRLVAGLSADRDDLARLHAVVAHVDERFVYGRRAVGLGDNEDAMPALTCDTHAGTCVDTHSYAVAAVRAAGIEAAYVSGVFFKDGQTVSAPGHCWFTVVLDGDAQHFDISHHIKYDLGPTRACYNPLPGTRFALSAGRDLVFTLPTHSIAVPTLRGFVDVSNPVGQALATHAQLC